MHLYWFNLYLFTTVFCGLVKGSIYNVAVVEYGPNIDYDLNPNDRLAENVKNYIKIIEETSNKSNQTLDLIVFPESTLMYLNTFSETAAHLPSSTDTVLCNSSVNSYATFLKDFSCAAIQYNTTVIINFTEKVTAPEQSLDNLIDPIFYNTNIAVGPNGTIIARYRKWNLFGEQGKSKPETLDLPVFEINNASFGMMTCFDIQFGIPAFNLTQQMKVKNIIFPVNWISELPYLTALQVQQMWAQEFNVVLLAAGASVPDAGAGGSGIFVGNGGALKSDILAKHGTKVLFHTVTTDLENQYSNVTFSDETDEAIDTLASEMDDFYMLLDPSIQDHNSVVLNTTNENVNTRVCHGNEELNLCCDFNISLKVDQNIKEKYGVYYVYQLVAFNGIRTYSKLYYGGVETCGLIACLNSSLSSCGQRFTNYSEVNWPITFYGINVTGYFTPSDQRAQFASTLRSSIRPLPLNSILWQKEVLNTTVIRKLSINKPQRRLLSFGIFGRDFGRDWDPIRSGISSYDVFYRSNNEILLYVLSAFIYIHCIIGTF